MDLTEFLLARIADDDRAAKGQMELIANRYPGESYSDEGEPYEVDRGWWLLVDPRHVAADCEAKRRIVEDQSGSYTWRDEFSALGPTVRRWGPGGPDVVEVSFGDGPGDRMTGEQFRDRFMEPSPPSRVLKLLALPYAHHPDYQSEWKP